MTIINPKSIAGVTSITTPSGSDNLFTVHTNNTTERVRINNDGDVIVGSGITVSPDGDIFTTGVTTATTFVGNLTGNATGLSGSPNVTVGDITIGESILHDGDADTSVKFPAADVVTINTGGGENARFTTTFNAFKAPDGGNRYYFGGTGNSADAELSLYNASDAQKVRLAANTSSFFLGGSFGVGTNSPSDTLHVYHATDNLVARFESGDTGGGITLKDNTHVTSLLTTNGAFEINVDQGGDISGETIAFKMSGSEKMRIDSSGRLLLGLTSSRGNYGNNASGVDYKMQIEGTGATSSSLALIRNSNDANDGGIILGKTRATSVGGNTVVQAGDDIGTLSFVGADGTSLQFGADIGAEVESGVGNDDMPTALYFKTNAGSTSTTERMRIESDGNVQLNRYSGDAGKGRLSFGSSSPAFVEGYDSGNAGSGAYLRMGFHGVSEKVRIPRDTWGLLVTNQGSTGNTGGYQTDGASLRYGGDSTFVADGAAAVTMTRKTNAGKVLDFYNGTTYAGGIYVNGSNNTALQQGSDYRLKTDITSMTDGIDKVKQLNPIYYKANSGFDTTTVQNGFLAHEVQSVLPTLVDGEKDAPIDEKGKGYQTLNYAGFTPTAIAAIKELIAKVEVLETRLNNAGIAT